MVAIETIKKKKRGFRRLSFLMAIILSLSLILTGCTDQQIEDSLDVIIDIAIDALLPEETSSDEGTTVPDTSPGTTQSPVLSVEGEMEVHFIDVGQADATLIIQNGHYMLFDAATKGRGDDLVEYLQNLGITYIDVLVLSHPHDDHMGGSAEVLNNIEVGKVYGPDIFELMDTANAPGWYEDMLDAIDAIDAKNNQGKPENKQTSIWHFPRNSKGEFAKFNLGDAIVEFYAPLEDEYSDKNDYSICAKVSFGEIDIMFTGDATTNVEKELLEKGYDLDVEIFQAGHHGSDTSNSEDFLKALSPECVVISCGMENKYNHPVKSVIELYEDMNLPVYRTDESGNIIMTTDGTDYSFNVQPGSYTSGEEYKKGN